MAETGSRQPSRRTRWAALALVLLAQALLFAVLLKRPLAVEGDNDRYELGGYNLAIGRGYALPLNGYGATHDPEVQGLVCGRHPEACSADTTHPVALYLPGYSVLIAGVYTVFGRSLPALMATQLVLLLLLYAVFEALAARHLSRCGYVFAMIVAGTYPFLARQATLVMSDHLHAVLFLAALGVLMLAAPGARRGAAFGLLIALSVLVRPYDLFVFPVLWLLALVWKPMRLSRSEWIAGAMAFLLPLAVWTARNAYWYGRFLPMTTGGAGALLYQASLEWDMDLSDPAQGAAWYKETEAKYGDVVSQHANQLETEEAVRRIEAHPWRYAERVAIHVPRIWITMATRFWFVSVLYLGGLLALGLAGAWRVRSDPRFYPLLVAVAVNWLCLLPLAGEARRTLPLRLPMILLAGAFVGPLIQGALTRRARRASEHIERSPK
jgi:4-amino-4-deoxy-L-arabinose transferase-like glycosyltransferase